MLKFSIPIMVLLIAILTCNNPGSITPNPIGSLTPTVGNTPVEVTVTVFFTDVARFQVGTEPYETPVTRIIPVPASLPAAVLTQMFLGPTETEKANGLAAYFSGTNGFSKLTIENGVARVYLTGTCNSQGGTYTIANLIETNLKQFSEIQWIKIYDQNGETENPDGQTGSIPYCLEP